MCVSASRCSVARPEASVCVTVSSKDASADATALCGTCAARCVHGDAHNQARGAHNRVRALASAPRIWPCSLLSSCPAAPRASPSCLQWQVAALKRGSVQCRACLPQTQQGRRRSLEQASMPPSSAAAAAARWQEVAAAVYACRALRARENDRRLPAAGARVRVWATCPPTRSMPLARTTLVSSPRRFASRRPPPARRAPRSPRGHSRAQ